MKKESKCATEDAWEAEEADGTPLKQVILSVSGNGTKTSLCSLLLANKEGATGVVDFSDLQQLHEFVGQLTIVAAQWEERLGNAKRG
jgi:hypothetical protein